jgi:hypothetical protein
MFILNFSFQLHNSKLEDMANKSFVIFVLSIWIFQEGDQWHHLPIDIDSGW